MSVHTRTHTFQSCPQSPVCVFPTLRGSPVFPTWNTSTDISVSTSLQGQLMFQIFESSSSRWSLPPLNFTVSITLAAYLPLAYSALYGYYVCIWLRQMSPGPAACWDPIRFIAFPCPNHSIHFWEFLVSHICSWPVPSVLLSRPLWRLLPKSHLGELSHCWALVRILLLPWFSQIHKNLWYQRSPYLFKPHCVPCRNLEMTPLPNPESDFLPLDPKQYSSGLSTHKIHLKAISLASGCNYSPKGKTGARETVSSSSQQWPLTYVDVRHCLSTLHLLSNWLLL